MKNFQKLENLLAFGLDIEVFRLSLFITDGGFSASFLILYHHQQAIVMIVKGSVMASQNHHKLETFKPEPFAENMPPPRMVAVKVPGRKTIVNAAIALMLVLSLFISAASSMLLAASC